MTYSIVVINFAVVYCLVGPHVVPHRFAGHRYRVFLLHDLPKLPEDVSLTVRTRVWYLHDGVPAHFRRAVRDILSNVYHDRWIGRGGPTAWPPRSPDLNPLDFYPWEHIKSLAYAAPVDNEETLCHRIAHACETICNNPSFFEHMWRPMMRLVEACIQSHGGHFEHLLLRHSFSYISPIECFRTHGGMDFSF
jgi:hypothetical protein